MSEFTSRDGSNHEIEKRVELEQIEVGPSYAETKPTLGQKAKRHCARWWWLHLIIFCASFLIVALCLVYVAMPKIAQNGVDDTSLEFTELQFLDPTPDSITLSQKSTLYSPSIFTPTLDPFNASLYLVQNGTIAAQPILEIAIPSIHAVRGDSEISFANQLIQIANQDRLADFAIEALSKEYITTALSGSTNLHEGALPVVTVDYNSQTTYKGLNGLTGFNVTGVKIDLGAKVGQPNIKGFAYIPNPSVMTIAMGNVTLSLSTKQEGVIGNSTILNMTLVPGNNTLPMTGILDQALVIESMDANGMVQMTITGQDAVYNGKHLTYYEKALASNKLRLTMNVKQIIANSS